MAHSLGKTITSFLLLHVLLVGGCDSNKVFLEIWGKGKEGGVEVFANGEYVGSMTRLSEDQSYANLGLSPGIVTIEFKKKGKVIYQTVETLELNKGTTYIVIGERDGLTGNNK